MPRPTTASLADAREFTAELIGTFALTLVGGAAIMQTRNVDAAAGLLEVALAHGLVLAAMVSALMSVSAHFNPAVTIALLVTGHTTGAQAVKCIGGQFAGALVAALSLKALFPAPLWEASRGARQLISLDVSTGQAFAIEAIATGLVMTAVMGTIVRHDGRRIGGLGVGITYAACMLAFAPLTGGSMNPARTLGPMLVSGAYEGLALYLTAPVVGAVIAALAYQHLLHPATVPQDESTDGTTTSES